MAENNENRSQSDEDSIINPEYQKFVKEHVEPKHREFDKKDGDPEGRRRRGRNTTDHRTLDMIRKSNQESKRKLNSHGLGWSKNIDSEHED